MGTVFFMFRVDEIHIHGSLGHGEIRMRYIQILAKPRLQQSRSHGLKLFHAVADSPGHNICIATQTNHGVTKQNHIGRIVVFFQYIYKLFRPFIALIFGKTTECRIEFIESKTDILTTCGWLTIICSLLSFTFFIEYFHSLTFPLLSRTRNNPVIDHSYALIFRILFDSADNTFSDEKWYVFHTGLGLIGPFQLKFRHEIFQLFVVNTHN